jgi:hypothetical protein
VDDVLCFTQGTNRDISTLKGVLDLYCKAIRMVVNLEKYCMCHFSILDPLLQVMRNTIPFQVKDMENRFKYLRVFLKPDNYMFFD